MDRTMTDLYGSDFDGRVYLNSLCNLDPSKERTMYQGYRKEKMSAQWDLFKHGEIHGHKLLEVGSGPTIDFVIIPCHYFEEVYLSDFNESCREEIELWCQASPKAFDWTEHFKNTMEIIGHPDIGEERQAELRSKVKAVLPCDVHRTNPLEPLQDQLFDCIVTSGCLNSACANRDNYLTAVKNVVSLLKPGGSFLSVTPLGISSYDVAGQKMALLELDEDFYKGSIERAGLVIKSDITKYIRDSPVPASWNVPPSSGYSMVHAVKVE